MRMNLPAFLLLIFASAGLSAQTDPAACPMHSQHSEAGAELDQRGDEVMGFGHSQTVHHFRLTREGGAIEVEVKDLQDRESLGQIRDHLMQVALAFNDGDFSMPGAIHDRVLPGVPEMTRLRDAISYRYEETKRGARVRIWTGDPKGLEAVHAFLRAQIEDHRTGDPQTVSQ